MSSFRRVRRERKQMPLCCQLKEIYFTTRTLLLLWRGQIVSLLGCYAIGFLPLISLSWQYLPKLMFFVFRCLLWNWETWCSLGFYNWSISHRFKEEDFLMFTNRGYCACNVSLLPLSCKLWCKLYKPSSKTILRNGHEITSGSSSHLHAILKCCSIKKSSNYPSNPPVSLNHNILIWYKVVRRIGSYFVTVPYENNLRVLFQWLCYSRQNET